MQWTEQDVFVGPDGREQLVGVRATATSHGRSSRTEVGGTQAVEWDVSYSIARMALEVRGRWKSPTMAAFGAWYSLTSNSVWEFLCRGGAVAELIAKQAHHIVLFVEDFHARMDERFATDTEPFGAPPVALNRLEEP